VNRSDIEITKVAPTSVILRNYDRARYN
jgi:hypothetical protein